MKNNTTTNSFYGLDIAPGILEILDRHNFTVPTPIQNQAIPVAIQGKDVMGIAQTGTGKTMAFGIPMVQRLAGLRGRGLVMVPTRELAIQVNETLEKFTAPLGMKTSVIIGGDSVLDQILSLRKNPRIIVATPGRLNDFTSSQRLRLDDVEIVVLDEADRMLDMGFAPQIEKILQLIPAERQTMLFSATMPPLITKLASSYMKMPVRVEVAPAGTAAELVTQELYVVRKEHKDRLLGRILDEYSGSVLLFTRTKLGAGKVTRKILGMGHSVAETHSNRSLEQRFEALEGFKSGLYRILVATDIAARGIDVTGIELVINYDIPDDPENYVHRIGRTGRAGQPGHAISLATPDQAKDVRNIEKVTGMVIPTATHPKVPTGSFASPEEGGAAEPGERSGRSGRRRGGGRPGGGRSRSERERPAPVKAAGPEEEGQKKKRRRRRRKKKPQQTDTATQ